MSYDDVKSKSAGDIKASEIFSDRALDVIKTVIGSAGINVYEGLVKGIADSLRKSAYILHSDGTINWSGTTVEFDSDAQANHIIYRILLTEDTGLAINARTIDLVLQGTTGANSATFFNSITLNDGEMLYLELDREVILNAISASPGVEPAKIIIENAVGGGSIVAGKTLRKTTMTDTSGMPAMNTNTNIFTGTASFNIPLAMRFDWDIGLATFTDIWWIPHGIRWPAGTRSALGGVVVSSIDTWPTRFINSELDLTQAIIDFSGGTGTGGIALINESFTITGNHTLPEGMWLVGRSNLPQTSTDGLLTVNQGASITMGHRSKLMNLYIAGSALHTSGALVIMSNDDAYIQECTFSLSGSEADAAPASTCVEVSGNRNKIEKSKFAGVVGFGFKNGVTYTGGVGNTDTDSVFT